jgi:hypothetical protein
LVLLLTGLSAIAASPVLCPQALAYGAVAQGRLPTDDFEPSSFAISVNKPSQKDADDEALGECRKGLHSTISRRIQCEVTHRFHHTCIAFADTQDQGQGVVIASTRAAAEQGALEVCQQYSDPGRGDPCTIVKSECDDK